jgi:hypothetical protein
MNFIATNWKTTAAGVATIGLGLLSSVAGVKIPGFTMDAGAAIITGLGLVMAKDGNVTGGTVKQ